MDSVLQNSGMAAGMMSCPKCGFAQETRSDCKKCGVVFSKYYALFPSGKTVDGIPGEIPNPQEMPDRDLPVRIVELQEQVRALSSRCAQVEFEKAERNQLRQDLRNLERQLVESVERLESRMDNPPAPPAEPQACDPRFDELRDKLEQAEATLGSFEFAGHYMVELSEKGETSARYIADLQQQVALLREDIDAIKLQLEAISAAQQAEEPRTPLEEDVHIIRKNLDDLRNLLSKSPVS
jgi:chromosome segregation ATPase